MVVFLWLSVGKISLPTTHIECGIHIYRLLNKFLCFPVCEIPLFPVCEIKMSLLTLPSSQDDLCVLSDVSYFLSG